MPDSLFIADVTRSNFDTLVIEKSREVPVLADFWAAWCGPCQMLMPVLAKLAQEYAGKFFLAKINSDTERELATQYGIRSLPTVKLFSHGAVAGEFMGAQPESTIRALLDRHVTRESDIAAEQGVALHRAGKIDQALALMRDAASKDPANERVKIALIRMLLSERETAAVKEAEHLLSTLPLARANDADVVALRAQLHFVRIGMAAASVTELERKIAAEGGSEARYQLSAQRVLAGQYEPAMQELLEIVKRDRRFGDDAARKTLVEVFNLLGNTDPLVSKYRVLLSRALN